MAERKLPESDPERDQTVLIVLPVNVLANWPREAETWTPELRVWTYYQSGDLDTEVNHTTNKPKADILLTTYRKLTDIYSPFQPCPAEKKAKKGLELTEEDEKELEECMEKRAKKQFLYDYFFQHTWRALFFDEAQKGCTKYLRTSRVRNQSVSARSVHDLPAFFKVAITGTVLTNFPEDVASLGMIVSSHTQDPARERKFWKEKGQKHFTLHLPRLSEWLRTHKLERTKEGLGLRSWKIENRHTELPQSVPHFRVETKIRQSLAATIRNRDDSEGAERSEHQLKLIEIGQHLEKASFSLFLVQEYKDMYPEIKDEFPDYKAYFAAPDGSVELEHLRDQIFKTDVKMAYFVRLVKSTLDSGETILLFTVYLSVMDLFTRVLLKEKIIEAKPLRICGEVKKSKDRVRLADTINNAKPDTPAHQRIMLCQLVCGGSGLNILARKAGHLTRWWNNATETQADGRLDRFGQTGTVVIERPLVCRNPLPLEDLTKLTGGCKTTAQQMSETLTYDSFLNSFRFKKSLAGRGLILSSDLELSRMDNDSVYNITSYTEYLEDFSNRTALPVEKRTMLVEIDEEQNTPKKRKRTEEQDEEADEEEPAKEDVLSDTEVSEPPKRKEEQKAKKSKQQEKAKVAKRADCGKTEKDAKHAKSALGNEEDDEELDEEKDEEEDEDADEDQEKDEKEKQEKGKKHQSRVKRKRTISEGETTVRKTLPRKKHNDLKSSEKQSSKTKKMTTSARASYLWPVEKFGVFTFNPFIETPDKTHITKKIQKPAAAAALSTKSSKLELILRELDKLYVK